MPNPEPAVAAARPAALGGGPALVLCDLDGTLIDSARGIFACIEHALAALALVPPPRSELRHWIGPPLWHSFSGLIGDDPVRVQQAIDHYRQRFHQHGWREHRVYDGIDAALTELVDAGRTLAVVTSKPLPQARRIVASLPFAHHVAGIYGPDPDDHQHTKDALVAAALAELGAGGRDAVMIGDRRFDMEGARANRITALGVLWGFGSRAELETAGADVVAAQPAQLPALIAGLPGVS